MQKRRLGRTDLSIAPLVFGGNVFGWTIDAKAARSRRATASSRRASTPSTPPTSIRPGSGQHGRRIGDDRRRLAEGERQSPRDDRRHQGGIADGAGQEGPQARYIEEAVEASLKRLKVETIDLYLSHWPDEATPHQERSAPISG